MLPCGELFDLLEMDASVEETGRTEVPGGRGWPRIVIDPAGPDAFAGRRPINPDDLRVEWSGTDQGWRADCRAGHSMEHAYPGGSTA